MKKYTPKNSIETLRENSKNKVDLYAETVHLTLMSLANPITNKCTLQMTELEILTGVPQDYLSHGIKRLISLDKISVAKLSNGAPFTFTILNP